MALVVYAVDEILYALEEVRRVRCGTMLRYMYEYQLKRWGQRARAGVPPSRLACDAR